MSNKAIYIGFLNSTNFGDLEIVNQQLIQLNKVFDEVEVFSWNFEKKDLPKSEIVINKNNNNLKKVLKNNYQKHLRKLKIIDYLHTLKIKSNYRNKIKNLDFIQAIKSSNHIFIGGGNVFFDVTTYSPSYYKLKLINDLAEKYNKKVYILQAGIGPFQTQTQINKISRELKRVSYISVRDIKSNNLLIQQDIDSILSVDPVFTLKNMKNSYVQKNCVGISLMDLSFNKMDEKIIKSYEKLMLEIIDNLENSGKRIMLFSSEPKDYFFIYDFIRNENLNMEIIYINNRTKLIEIFNEIDFTIATRMHSMIFSISQNTPVLGISWQDKIEGMYKTLGIEDYYLDLNNIEQHKKNFNKKIEQFISGNYYDVKSIKEFAENKVLSEYELLSGRVHEK